MLKVPGWLRWLYSATCPLCGSGRTAGRLCEACALRLPRLGAARRCRSCAAELPRGEPGRRCAACLGTTPLEHFVCLGSYSGQLAEAVLLCKFRGRRALAYDLGRRAAELGLERLGEVELVVPVPLGRLRRRQRGYNQAEDVARGVADTLRLPIVPGALRRRRETPPQTELSAAARQSNLRDAFRGSRRCASGRRVLLVDDVYTTGATIGSAARALLAAGASSVTGLALARVDARLAIIDSDRVAD